VHLDHERALDAWECTWIMGVHCTE